MSEPPMSLCIFTFSPVQSFIAEARRSEDLFNGSAILVRLAQAAAQALVNGDQGTLVSPASLGKTEDVPNVVVARLPKELAEERLTNARDALLKEWQGIAEAARREAKLTEDNMWQAIWQRQVYDCPPWQVFWVCVEENTEFKKVYEEASDRLNSLKYSRTFQQACEEGEKDSLSGKRSALHTREYKRARAYWAKMVDVLPHVLTSKIKPGGRERLDSIGLIKRFAKLSSREFPSTSTVASWDFYQLAEKKAQAELQAYREAIEKFCDTKGRKIYATRKSDSLWPYDGDLFFGETLTRQRLETNYGIEVGESELTGLKEALEKLRKATGSRPSPYYALIHLDGDGVGKKKHEFSSAEEHRAFSAKLLEFSEWVRRNVAPEQGGFLIYNGGDDILMMASLDHAIPLACQIAYEYKRTVSQTLAGKEDWLATMSAGIVIAHHLAPLSRVLETLHGAEQNAKHFMPDKWGNKDAVCVALTRRGGEAVIARSPWDELTIFNEWVQYFREEKFSASLPYLLAEDARVSPSMPAEAQRAMLRYRLTRQSAKIDSKQSRQFIEGRLDSLLKWVDSIQQKLKPSDKDGSVTHGLVEVANWLIIARFLFNGGKE